MSYFTIAEFRQYMPDVSSEGTYPDERITLVQTSVEATVERLTGTFFTPTAVTDVRSGNGSNDLSLSNFYIQSITSVTENGTLTSGYTYPDTAGGVLRRYASGSTSPTPWSAGVGNITVVYQAGFSATCPADLKLALMRATRDGLFVITPNSGRSTRASSMNTDAANSTFSMTGPDRPFGIPEVDVVVNGYIDQCNNGGFA